MRPLTRADTARISQAADVLYVERATRSDFDRVHQVYLARLDRARDIAPDGTRIGAPDSLVALGVFLHANMLLPITSSERRFGLDRDTFVGFADPIHYTGHKEIGERFADAILADLRRGGDGMNVRPPSKYRADAHRAYCETLRRIAEQRSAA